MKDQWIDDYLLGRLSREEQVDFERKLEEDEQLRNYVNRRKKAIHTIDETASQHLRKQFSEIEEELEPFGIFISDDDVDDYLLDRMPEDEKQRILTRQLNDPLFAERIKSRKTAIQWLDKAAEKQVRNQLREVEEEYLSKKNEKYIGEPKVIPMKRKNYLMWIAAAVVVIGLGVVFLYKPGSQQDLMAKYFVVDEAQLERVIESSRMSGLADPEAEMKESRTKCLELVQKYNYDEAIPALKTHLEQYPEDFIGKYYYGVSLMARSRYADAINEFVPVFQQEDFEFIEDAKYKTALCYLMLPDGCLKAKKLLEEIPGQVSREVKDVLDC